MMDLERKRRNPNVPDRRKYTYEELVKRIDDHSAAVDNRLHRFFGKALAVFVIIGLTSAISLFGFSIVLKEFSDTRKEFIMTSCVAQNQRHDETFRKFRQASAKAIKRDPKHAKEIRANIQDSLAIIEALAPKQDCGQLIKVAEGKSKPPPPTTIGTTHRGNP